MRDPSPRLGALSGAGWHQPLLPNEPRIAHPGREQRLTDTHLLPALADFEALLWEVRLSLDPELQARQPIKLGKPYPSSQCLEIAEAFYARLRTLGPQDVSAPSARGLAALRQFQKAGGTVRQVWGDLRGQYFQNAFQIGTLYVDVANDTVTPTKPKIEVLPFMQANFHPIRDHFHYVQVAKVYWGGEFYPNHLFPELAPHCPVLWVRPNGACMLLDNSQYMLALSRQARFEGSRSFLAQDALSDEVFRQVSEALQNRPDARQACRMMADTPSEGRKLALRRCLGLKGRLRHWNDAQTQSVIEQVTRLNHVLATVALSAVPRVSDALELPPMLQNTDALDALMKKAAGQVG